MGWFGKLTFGTMGLLFAGPLGAIAGAALGHHLFDRKDAQISGPVQFGSMEQAQAAYFVSIFSILGKLAKADGTVTKDEIAVVERFLSTLNIPYQQREFAKQVFKEAKYSAYSIDDFATQLYQINQGQPTILLSFMDLLFKVAAADGKFHPAEEAALKRVQHIFRISEDQYNNIKALYFNDVDKYYKILNCNAQSSNEEIKANYKRLVKDFHPDTIVSKGLPEEFTEFATNRFRETQEAYERIRLERGL